MGHYEVACRSKNIRGITTENSNSEITRRDNDRQSTPDTLYNVNIFRIQEHHFKHNNQKKDFRTQVIVNNNLTDILADTGAKISVCGTTEAEKWNLIEKMYSSTTKIKPYNSPPIPILGIARCAVTFGTTSVPVQWHIIEGSCEPVLSGKCAEQLGIIKFNSKPAVYQPICNDNNWKR